MTILLGILTQPSNQYPLLSKLTIRTTGCNVIDQFACDLPPFFPLSALHSVDRPVSPCDKSIASAAESWIVSNYFLRSTLVVMAWLRGAKSGAKSWAKSGASQLRELDKTLSSW